MKTLFALAMLLLSAMPARAQLFGSSVVFDPSVYARQLDQVVQQAQYWGAELQPLINAGQLFQQPAGFSNVMDTLQKVQSLSYTTEALTSQMQMLGQMGNMLSGCQGVMCVTQASSVLGQFQGGAYTMNSASQLYNQVIAGTSATAWGAVANPNPQPPSVGYLVPSVP